MDQFTIQAYQAAPLVPLHRLLGLDVPIRIVDIGANPINDPPPYVALMETGFATLVGFEPNAEALAQLQAHAGPNATYVAAAVGDGRRHTFRQCLSPGMSSLLQPNVSLLQHFYGFAKWAQVVATHEIDTVRLDDVAETMGMDYLKIDIQGAELMVFENAIQRLSKALVVQTEVEFLPMYVGQPLFPQVDAFLTKLGFRLHRLHQPVSRDLLPVLMSQDYYEGHSQLMWADAVYVRDVLGGLHLLDDGQLLRMAVILHDCYQAHDFVLKLLSEHERRTGSSHAQHFLRALTLSNGAGL